MDRLVKGEIINHVLCSTCVYVQCTLHVVHIIIAHTGILSSNYIFRIADKFPFGQTLQMLTTSHMRRMHVARSITTEYILFMFFIGAPGHQPQIFKNKLTPNSKTNESRNSIENIYKTQNKFAIAIWRENIYYVHIDANNLSISS